MKKGKFKYSININKLNVENTTYCYFIGLLSTDGYIDNKNTRICIRIRNEDAERVLNMLKTYFEFSGPIFTYKNKDKELRISSLELINHLTFLGLNKPKQEIPFLQFTKEENMKMYIRGIHDGDGNIKRANRKGKWKGGEFRLTNNNLNFQKDFIKWFKNKFKTTINLRKVKRKSGYFYEISTSVKNGKLFAKWFYSSNEDLKLKCKYSKYLSVINNDIVRT